MMPSLGWTLLALLQVIILIIIAYSLPQVFVWNKVWQTRRRIWLAHIIQTRHALRDQRRLLGRLEFQAQNWRFSPRSPKLRILWFL